MAGYNYIVVIFKLSRKPTFFQHMTRTYLKIV